MEKIHIIKVSYSDYELSYTALEIYIKKFIEIFSTTPEILNVGIDNIFRIVQMMIDKFDKELVKKNKLKGLWFYYRKDFSEHYWELEKFDIPKMTKYILYSNGV